MDLVVEALKRVRERTGDIPDIKIAFEVLKYLNFQSRCQDWVRACLGEAMLLDRRERCHRFFEEATELIQTGGMTKDECIALVNYVFDRPVGETAQEVGGVMTTLAVLCGTFGVEMLTCAENELARAYANIDQIRIKHANKPRGSSLPGSVPTDDVCSRCGRPTGPGGCDGYCDCPS